MYNFLDKIVNATNSGEAMIAMGIFAIVTVVCGLTVLTATSLAYSNKSKLVRGVLYVYAMVLCLTPIIWLIALFFTMNMPDTNYELQVTFHGFSPDMNREQIHEVMNLRREQNLLMGQQLMHQILVPLTFTFVAGLNFYISLLPFLLLTSTKQYKAMAEANQDKEEKLYKAHEAIRAERQAAKVAREKLAKEVELAKIQAEKEEMANLVAKKLYERMRADKKVGIHSDTESTTE